MVIYHLWPNAIKGGFVGVDVFFVISGFLMTTALIKRVDELADQKKTFKTITFFFASFYARRIRRLLPASFVVLVSILAVLVIFFREDFSLTIKAATHVFTSAVFVQNWELARTSVDYLGQTETPSAVQHFWSLSLEEQFYLIWPAILLGVSLCSLWLFKQKFKRQILFVAITIFTLVSLYFSVHLTSINPQSAYFSTLGRLWELSLGGIIVLLPVIKRVKLAELLAWAGMISVGLSLFLIDSSKVSFPGYIALWPTISTALVIWFGVYSKFSIERLSRLRPIQFIGNISYSLYLWHWPIIVLLPLILGISLDKSWWFKYLILVLAVGVSAISYKYIENFGQKVTESWSVKRVMLWAFVLVFTLCSLSLALRNNTKNFSQGGVKQLRQLAVDDSQKCFGAKAVINEKDCGNPFALPGDKSKTVFASVDNYNQTPSGKSCPYDVNAKNHIYLQCLYGDKNSKKTMLLFGDSHMQAYANVFDYVGKKNNIKVLNLAMVDCSAYRIGNPTRDYCSARLSWAMDTMLPSVDSIVAASSAQSRRSHMLTVVEEMISKANRLNKPVYLLEDFPDGGVNGGPDCLKLKLTCSSSRNIVLKTGGYLDRLKTDGYRAGEDFKFIETSQYFCDKELCYSVVGGTPVYFNRGANGNSHLTGSFAASMGYGLVRVNY